jgi:hypothetical protein
MPCHKIEPIKGLIFGLGSIIGLDFRVSPRSTMLGVEMN